MYCLKYSLTFRGVNNRSLKKILRAYKHLSQLLLNDYYPLPIIVETTCLLAFSTLLRTMGRASSYKFNWRHSVRVGAVRKLQLRT